jgi:hypothetical protein
MRSALITSSGNSGGALTSTFCQQCSRGPLVPRYGINRLNSWAQDSWTSYYFLVWRTGHAQESPNDKLRTRDVRHVSGRMDGRSRPSAPGARRPASAAGPQGALGRTGDSPGSSPQGRKRQLSLLRDLADHDQIAAAMASPISLVVRGWPDVRAAMSSITARSIRLASSESPQ